MNTVETLYPLSPMQLGILYHTLSEESEGVYVNQLSWRITLPEGVSDLDLEAFREAWRRAMEAHAVLRTAIIWEKVERPVQVVHRSVELPFHNYDLRDESPERRQVWLKRDHEELRERGFDLSHAPLFDVRLARLEDDVYLFRFSFQHIVLDGWSVFLLLKEVVASYTVLARGGDPKPLERRPFRDYVLWLDRLDLKDAERFWLRELEGITRPTPLVVDRLGVPPSEEASGKQLIRRRLSREDTERLRAFARFSRVTPYTLLQAAWGLVLSRYSGDDQVVFGSVSLGRPEELEGADEMIGLFVNTVPVRVEAASKAPAGDWLRDLQSRQLKARRYAASPLRSIHQWSDLEPGVPLFETLVVSSSYVGHSASRKAADLETADSPLRVEFLQSQERTNYPLVVEASGQDRLSLVLGYDRSRFDPPAVERMLGHLETTLLSLAEAAADPRRPVGHLIRLDPEDPLASVPEPLAGAGEERPLSLAERIAEHAGRVPDRPAVQAGGRVLTFAALRRRAFRMARLLRSRGVGSEDVVAACVLDPLELVPALLGIVEAGAAYLPLDATYPVERIAFMCQDAGARLVLIGDDAGSGRITEAAGDVPTLAVETAGREKDGWWEEQPPPPPVPESLAYVLYTSGSTGRPKGVMVPHGALASYLSWCSHRYGTAEGSGSVVHTPLGFDLTVTSLFGPLVSGRGVYFSSLEQSVEGLAELMRRERDLSLIKITPSQLGLLERFIPPEQTGGCARMAVIGGESLRAEHLAYWRRHAPELRLINEYGPTETVVGCCVHEAGADDPPGARVPIGRPVHDARIVLVGSGFELVPRGVPGEIAIGGASVTRGYLGRPGRTAESFVPDPFSGEVGARLYRAGDLAVMGDDGDLRFLGRNDRQVNVRGFRIELGEIEEVGCGHPEVKDAVAVVGPDPSGTGSLVVYVVGDETAEAEAEARRRSLTSHFAELLPKYMQPSVQVWLEELPRLPNGKIDRKELERRDPEVGGRTIIEPRGEIERRLLEIWKAVLVRSPVSVDDDFFSLGGNSLLAFRLMAKINQEFDRALPMSTLLLGGPATPERLAVELGESPASPGWDPVVPLRDGDRMPFFCVHPIGGQVFGFRELAAGMGPGQTFCGLQAPGLEDYDRAEDLTVTIERMAAGYVEAIQEEFPDGPYFIGGMSFGVTVAFEMAQQLWRAGAEVGVVALLDSPVPVGLEWVREEDYSRVLTGASREYAHQMGGSIDLALDDLAGRDRDQQIAHVLELLQEQDLVSSEIDTPMLRRFIDGHQARLTALDLYDPELYPGTLHLFRAAHRHEENVAEVPEELRQLLGDPEMGWGPYAAGGVVVHEFDAYHETLLQQPVATEVAARLQELIDDASILTTAGDQS